MNNLLAVVDGGASGSRYALYDADGQVIATDSSGPASLTLGADKAWVTIEETLERMVGVASAPDELPARLVMGLAGALQLERRHSFLGLIPATTSVQLFTDGYAQLVGATGGAPGVCLAAGTGTVVHWLDASNQSGMAGGWGYPVGDTGSGAWLGVQLLNDYLWYRDGESSEHMASVVFDALENHIGSSISEIQQWSTCSTSTTLAELVSVIADFVEKENPYAEALIARGVQECARLIELAPKELPVYLAGGLSGLYRDGLSRLLNDRLRQPEGDPLSGLYHLSQTSISPD